MFRRIAATLLCLLALNASAAEALRVCATAASTHETAAMATTRDAHAHHRMPVPSQDDRRDQPSDAAQCCAAMTSCSVSIVISAADDESRISLDRDAVVVTTARAPSFLDRSPEPPPPKEQA